jgi:hypothetical protein
VQLQVHGEKSRHRDFYRVSIAAHCAWRDLMAALRKSFADLERQLLRHLCRLGQEDAWRRKERRAELRRLKQAIDARPDAGAGAFGDLVRALLPKLQHSK